MKRKLAITLIIIALLALPIMGCASSGIGGKNSLKAEDFEFMSDLDGFLQAEMTGYAALQNYEAKDPLPFVDVTVKDIHKLMEDKESFVLFVSFSTCPWCNAVLTRFIDVANEAGIKVASLNTRKNPEWESNMDIDDYDLFVADFDEQLEYDTEGFKHLYVPHVFFVKEGEVVYDHQGALPEMGSDPYMELNAKQEEALRDIYREGFKKLLDDQE